VRRVSIGTQREWQLSFDSPLSWARSILKGFRRALTPSAERNGTPNFSAWFPTRGAAECQGSPLESTRLARALGMQGPLLIKERVHACFMSKTPLSPPRLLCRPLDWRRSSTSVIICEAPSPCLVRDWTHPTFRLRYLQHCKRGRHCFAPFLRLRTSDCD